MAIHDKVRPLYFDIYVMINRWRRAGYNVADMPHVLLTSAMSTMAEDSYNSDVMQIGLDNMKAHIDLVKGKVAEDWSEIERMKGERGNGTKIPNFDEHVSLFP